jgi:hypothetical protein
MEDMRRILSQRENTVIFSLFNEEDLLEEDSMEGYSISAWGQYQASADALRGYVHQQRVFWVARVSLQSFALDGRQRPVTTRACCIGVLLYITHPCLCCIDMHRSTW